MHLRPHKVVFRVPEAPPRVLSRSSILGPEDVVLLGSCRVSDHQGHSDKAWEAEEPYPASTGCHVVPGIEP